MRIIRNNELSEMINYQKSFTNSSCVANFIKAKALDSCIFSLLCEEMGSQHKSLLFYTAVRWLSQGKVLVRLFKQRHEISQY